MIVKRNFNPLKVMDYVKSELAFSLLVSIGVLVLYPQHEIGLPFSIAGILGSALAIFIAFRNNNSYGRWWEARSLWGGITNSSRVLGRLVITFSESHSKQPNFDLQRSENFKRNMIYKIIAWAHALRLHLRKQESWEDLSPFLNKEEMDGLMANQNKPNYLHLITGRRIYEAMADGTLGGFDSFQMEGQLLALANFQGGCERIKNTPLLRQYHFFTQVFMYVFILLLPFSLIGDFMKLNLPFLVVPVSLVISFVFAVIGKVGEVNEDPFENRITDVPLNALCMGIERDLREMLGETDLPPKPEPENGYLF